MAMPLAQPHRQPLIRRSVTVNPVDKTALWLNRAVMTGFIVIALYLTGHFTYALLDNVIRIAHLNTQHVQWKQLKSEKSTEHTQLTNALHQTQSPTGLEALVRNKLQWVEDKEVLIRIH
jgi:type VI protein secretion system component VasK